MNSFSPAMKFQMPMSNELFRAVNISVEKNNQRKLSQVNFSLHSEKVLGVFGLYDSGKRTILDAITGKVALDNGFFFVRGKTYHKGMNEFNELKLQRVSNTSSLIQGLSIWENLVVLKNHGYRQVFLHKTFIIKEVEECLQAFLLPFNPIQLVSTLTPLQQFFIELLRSYFLGTHIILIDDLSLELSREELELLSQFINRLKKRGLAILVTSRKVTILKAISDTIVFLSTGSIVHALENVSLVSVERIDSILMNIFPDKHSLKHVPIQRDAIVIRADGMPFGNDTSSFVLYEGEVVACIDPFKMVSDVLEKTITASAKNNQFRVRGKLQKHLGWRDRVVFVNFSVEGKTFHSIPQLHNLCFPLLSRLTRCGFYSHRYEAFVAKDFSKWAQQDMSPLLASRVKELTKRDIISIILYRLHLANPEAIFCQDPWNDTDYLSGRAIYRELETQAHKNKKAVCFIISNIENLDDFADRYLVISRDGTLYETAFDDIRKTVFKYDQAVDTL